MYFVKIELNLFFFLFFSFSFLVKNKNDQKLFMEKFIQFLISLVIIVVISPLINWYIDHNEAKKFEEVKIWLAKHNFEKYADDFQTAGECFHGYGLNMKTTVLSTYFWFEFVKYI